MFKRNGGPFWFSAGAIGVVSSALVSTTISCASMGFKYDEGEFKKQVAFETSCAPDKIKVVQALEAGTGHTKFQLEVCGNPQRWNRFGTSYFAEGKGPMGQ